MPLLTTPRRSEAGGSTINWDSFGVASDPPLVLIQGFSAQMLGWHPGFCQRLAEAGFHVIRFDNRDVGGSQRYPQGGYLMSDLADDTADLIEGLGLGPTHIVGQSMGGMIAQYLAVQRPDLVKTLGLLYTSAKLDHVQGRDDVIGILDTSEVTREQYVANYLVAESLCASSAWPQDVAWIEELGGEMYDAGYDPKGIQRQLECILAYTDRTDDDRGIAVPTAIMAGDSDRLIDFAASLELHELIPGSTLRIFPGMGHELPRALWDDLVHELRENADRA
jgi:pimeloyl-ACP methyl ester carboxylesterase